jgi:hypothetical protein
MYHRNHEANATILDLEKLNSFIKADISFSYASSDKAVTG